MDGKGSGWEIHEATAAKQNGKFGFDSYKRDNLRWTTWRSDNRGVKHKSYYRKVLLRMIFVQSSEDIDDDLRFRVVHPLHEKVHPSLMALHSSIDEINHHQWDSCRPAHKGYFTVRILFRFEAESTRKIPVFDEKMRQDLHEAVVDKATKIIEDAHREWVKETREMRHRKEVCRHVNNSLTQIADHFTSNATDAIDYRARLQALNDERDAKASELALAYYGKKTADGLAAEYAKMAADGGEETFLTPEIAGHILNKLPLAMERHPKTGRNLFGDMCGDLVSHEDLWPEEGETEGE